MLSQVPSRRDQQPRTTSKGQRLALLALQSQRQLQTEHFGFNCSSRTDRSVVEAEKHRFQSQKDHLTEKQEHSLLVC